MRHEITGRREVLELVLAVLDAPPMLSAGHGDPFHPHEVVFRFAAERSDTPGALLMPVTVAGPAAAATAAGPYARHRAFRTAAEMPPWLLALAEWAKVQPRSAAPRDTPRRHRERVV